MHAHTYMYTTQITCTHTHKHMHTHMHIRTHMQGQIRTPHTDLHGIIRVLRPVSVVCYYGPTGLSNHHLNTIRENTWHGRPVLHTITFSVIIPPGVQLQIMIRDSEWLYRYNHAVSHSNASHLRMKRLQINKEKTSDNQKCIKSFSVRA